MSCRWCSKNGHNRTSCPVMREEAKKDPNSHAARAVAYYSKPKRCSYCHEGGHNKSSCKKLDLDYFEDMKKNAAFRQSLLVRMKSAGLGIGALMEDSHNKMLLIENINWDNINFWGSYQVLKANEHVYSLHASRFSNEDTAYQDYSLTLCHGISSDLVEQQVPAGWTSGASQKLKDKYNKK